MEEKAESVALQALALAESNRRTLEAIVDMMGWAHHPLPVRAKEVLDLHEQVAQLAALPERDPLDAEEARFWSRILLRIHRPYLQLVESLTGEKQPWAPYLQLAEALLQSVPPALLVEQAVVFGTLDVARRSVQQVAYLYDRNLGRSVDWCKEDLDGTFDSRVLELLGFVYGRK